MSVEVVTRWFGCYAVEAGRVVLQHPFPSERDALLQRWTQRREGRLAPEEEALVRELHTAGKDDLVSRDRRLASLGVRPAFGHLPDLAPSAPEVSRSLGRELLLAQSRKDLESSWDPSIHLEEAVRALSDLDESMNLLGERLSSWRGREAPEAAALESAKSTALALSEGTAGATGNAATAPGPELARARRALAEVWVRAEETRHALEAAIEQEAPARFPNLCALLGPQLTARMLSQAGGISRLARMPASTVQVLGAERAFFEHLRGRGPPPRHGLLFLHAQIHTAPRAQRGKIARALAGKVAIAARRDLGGAATLPTLSTSFEKRLANIRATTVRRKGPRTSPPRDRESAPPRDDR